MGPGAVLESLQWGTQGPEDVTLEETRFLSWLLEITLFQ